MRNNRVLIVSACVVLVVILFSAFLISGCNSGKSEKTKETTEMTENSSSESSETESGSQPGPSKSEQALAQAKAQGKPVLLKFGSSTCIPCKQIEENISMVKPEYEGKIAFIIVDVYDQSENKLTTQYGIQTIPTTYFLGKDGTAVNNVVGVMTPDQLKQQLNALL